jgi:hypothetical protein
VDVISARIRQGPWLFSRDYLARWSGKVAQESGQMLPTISSAKYDRCFVGWLIPPDLSQRSTTLLIQPTTALKSILDVCAGNPASFSPTSDMRRDGMTLTYSNDDTMDDRFPLENLLLVGTDRQNASMASLTFDSEIQARAKSVVSLRLSHSASIRPFLSFVHQERAMKSRFLGDKVEPMLKQDRTIEIRT